MRNLILGVVDTVNGELAVAVVEHLLARQTVVEIPSGMASNYQCPPRESLSPDSLNLSSLIHGVPSLKLGLWLDWSGLRSNSSLGLNE